MAQHLCRQGRLLREHHRRFGSTSPGIRIPRMGFIQAHICGAFTIFLFGCPCKTPTFLTPPKNVGYLPRTGNQQSCHDRGETQQITLTDITPPAVRSVDPLFVSHRGASDDRGQDIRSDLEVLGRIDQILQGLAPAALHRQRISALETAFPRDL